MITGRIEQFQFKCARRGYTLDEVRACIVSQDGNTITVDENHPAYPRMAKPGFDQKPPRPGVSFVQRVRNFVSSAASHVAAGMPQATDEEIARRHDICMECQHYKDESCELCGCPLVRKRQFISKLAWADQACPAGPWGPAAR